MALYKANTMKPIEIDMKTKTKKILAEEIGEWQTDEVFQSGDSFFVATRNGGTRGEHQIGNRFPDYLSAPTEVSRDRALAECARMGVDEVDID
jgi:hypothetical protein